MSTSLTRTVQLRLTVQVDVPFLDDPAVPFDETLAPIREALAMHGSPDLRVVPGAPIAEVSMHFRSVEAAESLFRTWRSVRQRLVQREHELREK